MKKRNFLNYGGVTAVSSLVQQSRDIVARMKEQGFGPSSDSKVNLLTGDDGPELLIYGPITPFALFDDEVSAARVVEQLREVSGQNLTVRINSPGGSVRDGVAIFNLLKKHKGEITTIVDGMAGSIASVIFMAGDKRQMGEGSMVFVHNAMSAIMGNADDFRAQADILDKISGQIRDIYARRTKLSLEEITVAMDEETFYTEEEALAAGFTDEVIDLPEIPEAREPENRAPEPPEAPEEPEPEPEPPAEPEARGTVEDVRAARAQIAQLANRYGIDLRKTG